MSDDAIPQGGPETALPPDVPDPTDVEAFGAWADEQLRLIGDGERTIETYHAIAERRKKDADMWAQQESAKVERDLTYRRGLLEYAAKVFPFPRGLKSMSLPFGQFGTRVQPLSVEIKDAAKALEYAKMNGLTVYVCVGTNDPGVADKLRALAIEHTAAAVLEESVGKAALGAHAAKRRESKPGWEPDWMDDGWKLEGGQPVPFVKTSAVTPRKVEP